MGGALHPGVPDVEYGGVTSKNSNKRLIGGTMFQGKRKWFWIGGGIVLLAFIVGATVGGIKGSQKSSSSSSSSGIAANDASSGGTGGSRTNNPLQAGDGTTSTASTGSGALGRSGDIVTMENGQTFTYTNNFGGYFSNTPYDDSAKAQSYTPALNESWDYTNMK